MKDGYRLLRAGCGVTLTILAIVGALHIVNAAGLLDGWTEYPTVFIASGLMGVMVTIVANPDP